jgi:hypothetical protein
MIARTLFLRLAEPGTSLVSKPAFMKWWSSHNLASMPGIKRVFECLRKENQEVGKVVSGGVVNSVSLLRI